MTERVPERDERTAWACVVFIVAAGILAQVVGHGLALLAGVEDQSEPPLLVRLFIVIPTLAIAITPAIGAIVFGVRAARGARWTGWIAAAIGALAAAYWLFVSVAGIVGAA